MSSEAARASGSKFYNRSEFWRAPRQQRYRDACQISQRYNHIRIVNFYTHHLLNNKKLVLRASCHAYRIVYTPVIFCGLSIEKVDTAQCCYGIIYACYWRMGLAPKKAGYARHPDSEVMVLYLHAIGRLLLFPETRGAHIKDRNSASTSEYFSKYSCMQATYFRELFNINPICLKMQLGVTLTHTRL